LLDCLSVCHDDRKIDIEILFCIYIDIDI
jgi:hypothetical protein